MKRPCVLLTTPWDQTHGGVARVVHNLADHFSREGGRAFVFNSGESKTMRSKTTRAGFPGFEMFLPELSGGRRIGLARSLAWLSRLPVATRRLHRLLHDLGVDVVNVHCLYSRRGSCHP